ncbi:hypothetical protein WJX82_008077 [Trebouxia sp. C0006]
MASQVGQVPAPTHSGAETALSGAGAVVQDDGVPVDSPASPVAAGSQASVGPAGEPNLMQAAASAVYASSALMANDSALSVADGSGNKLAVAGAEQKVGRRNTRSHSSSPRAQVVSFVPKTASHLANQQQAHLPALHQEAFAAPAAASAPGQTPQSPYPHCSLASAQRGASAAASVEAIQQGDEDEDVQGGMATASTQATASGRKRQRAENDIAGPSHAARMLLSPECSEASQGHPHTAQHTEACQAAPETTQQATIQEAMSGQQFDEEAQQSAYKSVSEMSEEDCPASDAETDLSSVGLLSGRRQRDKGRQRLPDSTGAPATEMLTQPASGAHRAHAGNSQATSQRQLY